MESKKEVFKLLVQEFHGMKLPQVINRDLRLPDWCTTPPDGRPGWAVAITGPRRCGKTYALYQVIQNLCGLSSSPYPRQQVVYINFEDERLLPLKADDLTTLLDAYFELYPDNTLKDIFIFLDEVQNVESWELFVRRLLENEEARIFVAGSFPGPGDRRRAPRLPGRTNILALSPLSFKEFLAFKGIPLEPDYARSRLRFKIKNLLDEYLIYGGFPEVVLADPPAKFQVLRTYFDILVYKDLVERFSIRNIGLLKGLLKHLLTHIGAPFSINAYYLGLPPEFHVSRETVIEYISYLEQKGLISLIPILSDSPKARQVNPRRVFCLDNGIRNAVSFRFPQDEECLVKDAVFQKLKREGKKVFFWKDGGSVDFVVREDGKLHATLVSYGREMDQAGMKSIADLRKAAGLRDADLTVITKDTEKTEPGINFIPLWKWLLDGEKVAS